ncbi:MAG: GIY-YIG nuclease family protein [bacterium]|nr:GIY-YIG nuclease family protein [bacterium]
MFRVYILKSTINNRYYVGSTADLSRRLEQHNLGTVKSTKGFVPWTLAYQEELPTLSDARKRELQIKSWKKRAAIERLFNNF